MGNKYTTILIDGDDTILDFKKAMELSLKELFLHLNIAYTQDNIDLYERINDSYWKRLERNEITRQDVCVGRFKDTFLKMGIDIDPLSANQYYMNQLASHGFLLDGAYAFLESIASKFCVYMITNGTAFVQKQRISDTNIGHFFQKIYISEEVGYEKPSMEYFNYVLSDISQKDTSKILVIGDSLTSDIKGAVLSGLDSVWFHPSHKKNSTDIIPTYEASSFSQLLAILEDA